MGTEAQGMGTGDRDVAVPGPGATARSAARAVPAAVTLSSDTAARGHGDTGRGTPDILQPPQPSPGFPGTGGSGAVARGDLWQPRQGSGHAAAATALFPALSPRGGAVPGHGPVPVPLWGSRWLLPPLWGGATSHNGSHFWGVPSQRGAGVGGDEGTTVPRGVWVGVPQGWGITVGRVPQWEGSHSGKCPSVGRVPQWEGSPSGKGPAVGGGLTVGSVPQWEGSHDGRGLTVGGVRSATTPPER